MQMTQTENVHDSLAGTGFSFADMVEVANDIFIVTTADLDAPGPTIVYVNPAFTRLTGYTAEEAIGRSPRILQGPGTSRAALDRLLAALRLGETVHEKVLNYSKSGAPYWLDLRISPLRDRAGVITHFVAIERDVTLDKRRLDELEVFADRDTLTGILNRRALLRSLESEMREAAARGAGPCLAFLDVDHFKAVNDTHGHPAGDAVLVGVADRLAENIRRVDTVGRIGGEEFAVCMPSITLSEAASVAERLRRAVGGTPMDTPAGPVTVTISVGVSQWRGDGEAIAEMMARADTALYAAKRAGRDRIVTESPPESAPRG